MHAVYDALTTVFTSEVTLITFSELCREPLGARISWKVHARIQKLRATDIDRSHNNELSLKSE